MEVEEDSRDSDSSDFLHSEDAAVETKKPVNNTARPYFYFPDFSQKGSDKTMIQYTPLLHQLYGNSVESSVAVDAIPYIAEMDRAVYESEAVKREHNIAAFNRSPIHYMALGYQMVYGITARELRVGSVDLPPDKKVGTSSSRVTKLLKKVTAIIQKSYEENTTGSLDMDSIFPITRITHQFENTTGFHKKGYKTEQCRIIPVYVLPFFLKTLGFQRQSCTTDFIDRFLDELRHYYAAHKEIRFYEAAFYQLRANMYCCLHESEITAYKLSQNLTTFKRKHEELLGRVSELEETVRHEELLGRVSELEEMVSYLREEIEALKKDKNKKRKVIIE